MKLVGCLIVLLGALSLVVPGYAVTGANNETATTAEKKAKKKKDKVQCKRVTVTGSHFKKKVCLKQSKWEEMAREAREASDGLRDRSAISGS